MLISCNSASDSHEKRVFKYNSATGITSLDPAFARTQENIRAVNQLFNGLVQLDSNLNVVPCIAKNWTISDNSKVYTFTLRNNVFFHNHDVFKSGKRAVNAQDFAYSFNRIISPETASDGAWIFNEIIDKKNAFEALNDSTFILRLNKPFAPLLSMLTMAYCYVIPQEGILHYGSDFGKNPIGTGPFKFANWQEGIKLNLLKNEDYFETKYASLTNIDAISVSFIQSKQTELLEFIQGKLDVFTGLESSFKDEILTGNGDLKSKYAATTILRKTPFLNTEYLAFNLEDKNSPVYNLDFRRAMSLAINRESMIKYLRNNIGIAANGGFTPIGLPSHYQGTGKSYNKQKALEYLVKSGIIQTKPIVLATTRDYLDLCVLVQKNLAEIGIEIKIDVIPSSLLKQQKSAGDLAFFRSSWIADYPDGENYMACFYSKNKAPNGPNYTRYQNPTFDAKYKQLLTETDQNKRKQLFLEMEQILEHDCPYILLYYDQSIWLYSTSIRNLKVNSLNHLDLRQVIKG